MTSYPFYLFITLLFFLTLPLCGGEKEELETRIELLRKEIKELRLKKEDAIIQSQRALRSNSVDFVNDIEWSESYDKMARIKEQDLQDLLKQQQVIDKAGR